MRKNILYKRGFTLLETLVAISILTVATGAAFSMAQKSLSSASLAKNQTIAYFLAAEGLELVRTVRDNVAIYNINNGTNIDWIQPLRGMCGEDLSPGCDIKSDSTGLYLENGTLKDAGAIKKCDPECKLYLQGEPLYYYSSFTTSGNLSPFKRVIHITEKVPELGKPFKKVYVSSTVTVAGQSYTLNETLTNW